MKKTETNEQGVKQQITLRSSGMPYALAGAVFLLCTATKSVYTLWSYIWPTALAAGAYAVGRLIWPGKKVVVDLPPDTGNAQCDQLLVESRQALAAIRKADEGIADEAVSQCIREIDEACQKLLFRLEEEPELHSQLRTFLRYYLPTTRKILDNRAMIEQKGYMDEQNAKAVCERTDRVLPEIRKAFQRQLEAVNEHSFLDVQVEMDVLEGMMKSDAAPVGATATQAK